MYVFLSPKFRPRCKDIFCVDDQVQMQIWSRGTKLLRPKVADIVEWSYASNVSYLWPGSRFCLRALETFGFLMLKYQFSDILETLSVIVDIYFNTKSKDFYFLLLY